MPTELSQNQITTQDFFIKKTCDEKEVIQKHVEFKNKKTLLVLFGK